MQEDLFSSNRVYDCVLEADGNMTWNNEYRRLGSQGPAQYFNSIPRNMPPGQHWVPDSASLGQYHNSEQLVASHSWHETDHQGQQHERKQPSPGDFQLKNVDNQINPAEQPTLFSSPLDLGRRWYQIHRTCYRQQRSQNFGFTVVSYNVLADGLLNAHSDLYAGTEQWLQQWEYRRRNLLKEILYYKADVSDFTGMQPTNIAFSPHSSPRGMFDRSDTCASIIEMPY